MTENQDGDDMWAGILSGDNRTRENLDTVETVIEEQTDKNIENTNMGKPDSGEVVPAQTNNNDTAHVIAEPVSEMDPEEKPGPIEATIPSAAIGERAQAAAINSIESSWVPPTGLDPRTVNRLKRDAVKIRITNKGIHFLIFQIGNKLDDIHKELGAKEFERWAIEACDISRRSAYNYRKVFLTFKKANAVTHLPLAVLYKASDAADRIYNKSMKEGADDSCDGEKAKNEVQAFTEKVKMATTKKEVLELIRESLGVQDKGSSNNWDKVSNLFDTFEGLIKDLDEAKCSSIQEEIEAIKRKLFG